MANKKLPPGPRALPLLGNILSMMDKPHLQMCQWAKEYGKIYKIQLGMNVAIVLNEAKLVKEVLGDANFAARPDCPMFELLVGGKYGIVSTDGQTWEEQRRWSIRKLRDLGFGKTSMEGLIMEEVNEMTEIIKKTGEQGPMKINELLDIAVLNSLWTLMNGQRSKQNDPLIREMMNAHHNMFRSIAESGLMFVPWLKYIFPNSQKTVDIAAEKVVSFSREAVAQHWDTYQDGVKRDFIDEYIAEIKRTTDKTSSFYGEIGGKHLVAVVGDLIQAGSETTSNTLSWMLCYLTEKTEVQRKVHEELDRVVGSFRQVGLADKSNIPYTEAMILETLRYSALVAAGVQRTGIQDKVVDGYTIPKGCWILPNIYYIHHDPAVWGDPENFRPERFLSEDGTKVVKHEALIPFQAGKRQCLGESLGRDTLFLFAANLLNEFSIERVEKEWPEVDVSGFLLMPKAYNYVFKLRK